MRIQDVEVDQLADQLEGYFGGADKCAYKNYDLDGGRVLGTARRADFPAPGLVTACTFGFVHEDWSHRSFPDRLELVAAWDDASVEFAKVLVVVVREAIRQRMLPKPGVVFEDGVRAAGLGEIGERMPHALILFPYLWDKEFQKTDLEKHRLWFLQVVPIHDDELAHIETHGFEAFEEILKFEGAGFEKLERISHAV